MAKGRFNVQRSVGAGLLAVALAGTGAAINVQPVKAIPRLDSVATRHQRLACSNG